VPAHADSHTDPPPEPEAKAVDFGNVDIYDYEVATIRVTNKGDGPLVFRTNSARIVDANDNRVPEYSFLPGNCANREIKPDEFCTTYVQFYPTKVGTYDASIQIGYFNADEDYFEVPLTGVGYYEEPESVEDAEEEAENTGEPPAYEVAEPERPTVSDDSTQEVSKKNGKYVVKTSKKKINVKWKAPDTDQPVTTYEIRSKFKKKSWKKWKDVDPRPDFEGWIKASVKAKKSGNYTGTPSAKGLCPRERRGAGVKPRRIPQMTAIP